jgi:hypothetical protein
MSIWQFYNVLSQRLLTWNVANIAFGLLLLPLRPFWRGFGSQNIGWGLINIGIAVFGGLMTERRFAGLPDPHQPDVVVKESANLRRILWINTALDVLYMLGGLRWAQTRKNRFARGAGWGIVLQGTLLFVFDLVHALAVPDSNRVR